MDNQEGTSEFQDIIITRRIADDFLRNQGLKKVWTIKYLVALGMGTVLVGFYTQWNVPGELISSFSFLTALSMVGFVYAAYLVVVSELAVLFPYAGGHYAFARRGLGKLGGYVAGTLCAFQFVFGAAALSLLFKKFMMFLVPDNFAGLIVASILIVLMLLHVFDLLIAAQIQVFLFGCGISGLIIFFIGCSEGEFLTVSRQYLPFWSGVGASLPLTIWYFFGLEGLSLVGEESRNPNQILTRAMATTLGIVFLFSFGLWFFTIRLMPELFFQSNGYPLLFILQKLQSQDKVLLKIFFALSLCVYISALNGLINGFSRQVYSLARGGYYPSFINRLHSVYRTPYLAIMIPGIPVLAGFLLIELDLLVYFSLISAFLGHLLIMISYYRIQKFEPDLFIFRRFSKLYRLLYLAFFFLIIILGFLIFSCGADTLYLIYFWVGLCFYYFLWAKYHIRDEAPEEFAALQGEKRTKINFR